jgi:muconolactone delta-isomerase
MLFQIEMDVQFPPYFPAERADELKQAERDRAKELQKAGIWRHLWRVAASALPVHDDPGHAALPPSVIDQGR